MASLGRRYRQRLTMAIHIVSLSSFLVLLTLGKQADNLSDKYIRCLSGLCSIVNPQLCNKSIFTTRICPNGCSSKLFLDQNATTLLAHYKCAEPFQKSSSRTIKYCKTQPKCNSHLGISQDFHVKKTADTLECLQSTRQLNSVTEKTVKANSYPVPCTTGLHELRPMCQIYKEQYDGDTEIAGGAACSQDFLFVRYSVQTENVYEYIYYTRNCKTDFCTGTNQEAVNNFHKIFPEKDETEYRELKIKNKDGVEISTNDEYSRIVFNDTSMIKAFIGFMVALFIMFVVVLIHSLVCNKIKNYRRGNESDNSTAVPTNPMSPQMQQSPNQQFYTPKRCSSNLPPTPPNRKRPHTSPRDVIENRNRLPSDINWEEVRAQPYATFERRKLPKLRPEQMSTGSLKRNMQLFVHFEEPNSGRLLVSSGSLNNDGQYLKKQHHTDDEDMGAMLNEEDYEDDSCV